MFKNRRDMDLIRLLLMRLGGIEVDLSGYDDQQVAHHYMLLEDVGFINGVVNVTRTFGKPIINLNLDKMRLNWKGQNLLDLIADEDVWEQIKTMAGKPISASKIDMSGVGEVKIAGSVAGRDMNFIIIGEENWAFLARLLKG